MKTIYGHQATGSCGLTEDARKCALRGANLSSRFANFILHFAAVLLLMVVGVSGVKATDYYYFIVNKSGKIVTYALTTDQTSETTANGDCIPDVIKSVNANNWRLYNSNQFQNKPTVKIATGNTDVIDCSSWGNVSLKDNAATMSTLADCENVFDDGKNYIFVFCDYDETSVPDLRNEAYYTLKYRGQNSGSFAYYDSSSKKIVNTGNTTVTNPENNDNYLWRFKGTIVNDEIDPYDVKIYNFSVGSGSNDHFVGKPVRGNGPEGDNNYLTPLSNLSSATNTTFFVATSYFGEFIIVGKQAYNAGNYYYSLWAKYQGDSDTRAGITNQMYFQRDYSGSNKYRRYWSSISLTPYKQTYIVVDNNGNESVRATTTGNNLEIPDIIKSPLATDYKYYSDAACTNEITSSPGPAATIYVRYTTNNVLDLSGGTPYNIKVNGNYLYDNNSALALESSDENIGNSSYTWTLTGDDAYQIVIQNVANTGNKITYDVSTGEAAPSLGAGSKFFLHAGTDGKYEIVATTTADFSSSYYTLGVANNTLKLYSNSNYPMGEGEVQTIIERPTASLSAAPTANTLTYNKTEQELVSIVGIVVKNGTLQFRIGESGDYSEGIPKAINAGTYTVYYKVKGNTGVDDFIPAYPIEVTINKQSITVSGITANNKTYDGTADAELVYTGASLTGKVEGDDLTITATGAFNNKNVGTGKPVTISGLTLGGSAVSNYELATSGQQTSTTATITAKEITVSGITAENKVYDGTATATLVYTSVTLTGKVEGDNLTVATTAIGTFVDKNVGTGKNVTISGLTLGGSDASNYVLAATGQQTSATANITAKEITVSGITAENKEYDGNTTATLVYTGVTIAGKVEGDNLTITATGSFDNKNVGTDKNVTISDLTLGGSDASNYSFATSGKQTTAKANITAKDITASATITASNKEYNGNTTATLVVSNVTLTGKVDGDDITFTATGTFADKKVGTAKTVTISLTLSGNDAGNYNLKSPSIPTSTTADITVKEVTATGTITASNKTYDGKTTAVLDYTGVTLTGKVVGDDLTVSATGTFADKNVGTDKTVNISEWVLAGTDKDNYRMASTGQPTTVTANITAAEITVSGITAKSKVYDGNTTATLEYTSVTLTGKVEGETLTVTATGAFADKNVGTDKDVTISGLTLGGSDVGNYALKGTGQQTTAKANITAKEITISGITASNKEYDGNTTATLVYTGVTYTGKLDGETLTVTATGAFADKNVGTDKTVTISELTLDGTDKNNYKLASTGQQTTAKANITRATATVTAENKEKGFGDADPTFTWTVTGLKGSDTKDVLTVTISRETGEDVRVTPYTITPAGEPTQGNYTVTYATGKLTITPKAINDGTNPAEGIDVDITYDGGTNYTVVVKQGEKTLVKDTDYELPEGSENQYDDADGNHVITIKGKDGSNYTGSFKATYIKLTFWDTTPDQTLTSETTAAVYCATQNLKVNESFEAYYVTNLADNTLTLTKVEAGDNKKNYIPANQPLLLISDAATAPKGFTVKPYTGTGTDLVDIPATGEGSNLLKVVTDAGGLAVALTQVYIFSQGEFVLTKAGTMSKGKFYLENPNYSTSAPSRSIIRITTEGTTGINTAQYIDTDSQHSDIWYTIGGQKLNNKPTRKGLYLQNGKKVVIK